MVGLEVRSYHAITNINLFVKVETNLPQYYSVGEKFGLFIATSVTVQSYIEKGYILPLILIQKSIP